MITAALAVLSAAWALGMGARMALAARWFARPDMPPGSPGDVTVMIPVLAGDPALESCLAANLDNAPDARFVLLVDQDDAEGLRIAGLLGRPNATVMVGPPPASGENPKVAKLSRAFATVSTGRFAVLDDDTVLPPGSLARAAGWLEADAADLVTGLPAYAMGDGFFTRLLAAFVNGSVAITYPVGALLGEQRTLNGMFYAGRTDDLRRLGGFEAIRGVLTDDYAMAKLYLDGGMRLAQSRIVHPVRTTVTGPIHHMSIMRRWMIFANRYLSENPSAFTIGLVGGTTLAPPLLLGLGLVAGPMAAAAVLLLLLAKALAMRLLRSRLMGRSDPAGQIPLEAIADLLTPLHALSALVLPSRFGWRSRKIRMDGERITYE